MGRMLLILAVAVALNGCATCTKSKGSGWIDTPQKKVAAAAFGGGSLVGFGGVIVGIAGASVGLPIFLGGWIVGSAGLGYLWFDDEKIPRCNK